MIDTKKPLIYAFSDGRVSHLSVYFIGLTKEGKIIVQIDKDILSFNADGTSSAWLDMGGTIRNTPTKTKLYYKTFKHKEAPGVICCVASESYAKCLADDSNKFILVDSFERETEL